VSKLKPLDLMFFALESPNRPVHMAGWELFRLPADDKGKYIAKLVDAFRAGPAGEPFNKKIRWGDWAAPSRGLASWEIVEPDMRFHVRHWAVPKPGRMEQLYDMLGFLNAPMLDRNYPLWECHIIEGIENRQFAIFVKVHHALMDGMGGMRLLEDALSTSSRSRKFTMLWSNAEPPKRKSRGEGSASMGSTRAIPGVQKMASSLLGTGRQLLKARPWSLPLPFGAKSSKLNAPLRSAARSFGSCDLPLDRIRQVGEASGATINDIVMTAIDIGLQNYFAEQGGAADDPLRVMMPVSLRSRGGGGKGGNQVSVLLVELGPPDASPRERLEAVIESTGEIKGKAEKVPAGALQFYTLLLALGAAAGEVVPGMDVRPTLNLLVSNMPGPKKKLYLAGAPMLGFYGMPIVPPGAGLNVTFMSYGDAICLSVGANPDAISDAFRLSELIREGFEELATAVLPRKKAVRKSSAKSRSKK
jgi:WS/DGAT/MGAT family acyltransferase